MSAGRKIASMIVTKMSPMSNPMMGMRKESAPDYSGVDYALEDAYRNLKDDDMAAFRDSVKRAIKIMMIEMKKEI